MRSFNKFDINSNYSQKIISNHEIRINPKNEIKISKDTDVKKAIDFICDLFNKNSFDTVNICGLNLAINKVILITEIVKTKIHGLHQLNNIDCLITKSQFGEIKRIPRLEIILTIIEPECKGMGYQCPMSEKHINLLNSIKYMKRKSKKKLIRLQSSKRPRRRRRNIRAIK